MNTTPNNPIPTPSPFEQQGKKRSQVRIIAFIVGVHVVFLGGILIQGCKPGESLKVADSPSPAATNETTLPQENPNYYKSLDPVATAPSSPTNNPAPEPVVAAPATPTVAEPTPAATVTTAAVTEYEVKPGDSFAKVAKSHGVTLNAMLAANAGVDPARLKIGQKIQIPTAPPAGSLNAAITGSGVVAGDGGGQTSAGGDYVVKSGDSLIRIAKKHGVSVKALRSANSLKTTRIQVGQHLKIPAVAAATPKETASATNGPTTN